MCDSEEMYNILIQKADTNDQIINDKIHFINQLTEHRNLKISFKLIKPESNIATEYLSSKDDNIAARDSRDFV